MQYLNHKQIALLGNYVSTCNSERRTRDEEIPGAYWRAAVREMRKLCVDGGIPAEQLERIEAEAMGAQMDPTHGLNYRPFVNTERTLLVQVFTRDDDIDSIAVATRPEADGTWGPPIDVTEET